MVLLGLATEAAGPTVLLDGEAGWGHVHTGREAHGDLCDSVHRILLYVCVMSPPPCSCSGAVKQGELVCKTTAFVATAPGSAVWEYADTACLGEATQVWEDR